MYHTGSKDNMKFRIKTMCQNCLLTAVILFVFIFAYHEVPKSDERKVDVNKLKPGKPGWLERAPRSLNKDYSDNLIGNDINTGNKNLYDKYKGEVSLTTSSPLSLDDLYLTIKTTKRFHKTRLDTILKTWFNTAKKQTYVYTDFDDPEYQRKTGGHLINTNCKSSHSRRALCCKMAKEFDGFLESQKKWWCHFDDDNYVNIPALVKTLEDFNPQMDWYVGKPSIKAPFEISDKIAFWFATGGAGFCISKSLALKMMPIAGGGKFISVGEKIRLPDDVTMGYIIEHILNKKLTVVESFHSHLEPMRFLNPESLSEQITFSYSQYAHEMNVLPIPGLPHTQDPTKFLALHCLLYPTESYCTR